MDWDVSWRGSVRAFILAAVATSLGLGACKTPPGEQASETSGAPAQGDFVLKKVAGLATQSNMKGISTEHDLTNVTQDSACGLSQSQIRQIQRELGVYYVAPQDNLFWTDPNKPWVSSRTCGRLVEVTFGGACYANHDWKCMEKGHHLPIPDHIPKKVTLFVADWCGNSCARSDQDLQNIHLDIAAQVYQQDGPLFAMRQYLQGVEQRTQKDGKTIQAANLFVQKIVLTDTCVVAKKAGQEIYPAWVTTACKGTGGT